MNSNLKIYYARISNNHEYSVPKRIGAYVITHTTDNITAEKYVGASENLYTRMYGHYNKHMIYIDLFITDNLMLAKSLERVLSELLQPSTNIKMLPLSEEDRKLMNELLEDKKIKEILSNNTIKIGCRYLKYVINEEYKSYCREKVMINVSDNVHLEIIKKRTELLEKGIKMRIQDIADKAILNGLNSIN